MFTVWPFDSIISTAFLDVAQGASDAIWEAWYKSTAYVRPFRQRAKALADMDALGCLALGRQLFHVASREGWCCEQQAAVRIFS